MFFGDEGWLRGRGAGPILAASGTRAVGASGATQRWE
jgi:hypothetical protein